MQPHLYDGWSERVRAPNLEAGALAVGVGRQLIGDAAADGALDGLWEGAAAVVAAATVVGRG